MTENPYSPPTESHKTTSKVRRHSIARAVAIGFAATGGIFGILSYFTSVPVLVAARLEVTGGGLALIASSILVSVSFVTFLKSRTHNPLNYILALLFLLLGSLLFLKGYSTVNADQKRFNDAKSNLELVSEALEKLERTTEP